jgi:predicted TPR repeat methyltransferase
MAAHKGGRLHEAEVGYRSILRSRPRDPDALNFLGMLCVQRGDAAGGVDFLRRSVQSVSANPHAWLNLGNALMAGGAVEEARSAFQAACERAPQMSEAWFNLGVCHRRLKSPTEALSCFRSAVEHGPGYAAAYEAMATLLYRAGRNSEAAEAYREWLKYEPDNSIARHMLAATSGEGTPARAGDDYVAEMFDKFAETFDENLQELGYRAPELVAAALRELLRPVAAAAGVANAEVAEAAWAARPDVLDAGCGTGLCGPLLRPLARSLVGVDLSGGMTGKARARGGYDELVVGELVSFMASRAGAFDAIVSADTLVYFGALEEALRAAHASLRDGGLLVFTVERVEGDARYRLEPHGRYAHSEAYVREAMSEAGFRDVTLAQEALRRERGAEVNGYVVVGRR